MSIFTNPRVTRRSVLAATGGAALLAGGASLTGCSNSKTAANNTAAKNEAVKLPTYDQYTEIKPDLPGTEQGVDNAFRTWPTDNPKSVPGKPGTGKETVSGMANIYYAAPPGPSRNSFWAGLNERLGVDLKLQMVGNADYNQKYATTIAGSDLPDVMQTQITSPGLVANLPTLLDKRFSPLDEHLGGDAIKDYPNLANIPETHWTSTIFNGHIYGIPIPRGRISNYNFVRQDLWEAKGLSLEPKGYDELLGR